MIRRATPDDAAGIARVQVATWRHAYAGLIDATYLDGLSVPAGTSRWEGLLADPEAASYVAVEDGEVVGFATAGPARDDDAEAGAGEVYAVYVRPDTQRTGLGTALLNAACGWLAGRGHRSALLWVLTGNAGARAFYAARGGEPDGTNRTIDVGGAIVAEVRYRFVLVPAT